MPFSTVQENGNEQTANGNKPPPDARLLVVDDEESLRITTAAILEQEGYTVDTAASGMEAFALLEKFDFDLVLTDLHMEGGDGLSVLAEIRRRAPLTISVVLTGFASVESAIAALQQGAYDYLVKPCDIDEMKHTIKRGVEHRRLMLAEQEARENLEQLNHDLEHRVEERTAELSHLNEELEEANRAKDIFLATLSHELRTPLTPVLGWINLLRNGNLDSDGVAQALDAIERNARLQSRLIDDLLDISRIATGKLRFDPQPCDLNATVEAAVETVRSTAAVRRVELEAQLTDAPLVVMGEPVRLQQIVWNLLSNAIKFTEAGGRVKVWTERAGHEARIMVEDTGIGIPADFLPHVFDRFRQADGSRTRRHGGLGLGLAIVDALVRLHNGRIEAESEGAGRGSRFTFTLPLDAIADHVDEKQQHEVQHEVNQCVLIIEDSPDTLSLLCTLFEQKGCSVVPATSAHDALRLASEQRPSIIISDIGIPHMDGYELLRELRRLPGLKDVPAIAVSGYAMEEDRERASSAGFIAHLAKPINVDELFALIQKLTST
ncbi:MAG: hybrid sensor histidine kinase/response regulator [Acidobacteria bacterium]|nr:MAG: hybrid sensor histidine kinase/response regulator [Acidobacteriota bacterium]